MDTYVTGSAIRRLREEKHLTQNELARLLSVSSKTISKWETARGLPDISLLEPLAAALGVSVLELMRGEAVTNCNRSANLLRSKLYVCPVCGNVLHASGQAVVSCCGVALPAQSIRYADEADEHHQVTLERVEDELFVTVHHPMDKTHFISFIACVTGDHLQLVRLYPEGSASCRFPVRGAGVLYFYCNRHGLMRVPGSSSAARPSAPPQLHLREPEERDREQVMAYRSEFLALDSRLDGTSALADYEDFGAWLAHTRQMHSEDTVPPGWVPGTVYLALDEQERLIGMVDIRHLLNDRLLQYAGHIGYSVRPSQRKRGCATEILRLALEQCRARGIERVRISCDRYNAASARVILANGGVPDGELFDPADGIITQRFWIDANK